MAKVFLGVGSNIEPEAHLRLAVRELGRRFGALEISPVYESAAVGFEGDNFLNLVVGLETLLPPAEILRAIAEIHALAGRRPASGKLVSRELDIDLLLYDGLVTDDGKLHVPRSDVLEYSFVLRPLAELAPGFIHPVTGRSLGEHWRDFDADRQPLRGVAVDL